MRRRLPIFPSVVMGGVAINYLLRDKFTAELAAGSVDDTAATPGPGLRDVTDVESKIFTLAGRLRGGGQDTPVWGQSRIVWTQADASGFARQAGRAVAALILPEDTSVTAEIVFGWASASNVGDPQVDGLGWHLDTTGDQRIATPSLSIEPQYGAGANSLVSVFARQYLIVVGLLDQGGFVLASTFANSTLGLSVRSIPQYPLARVIWITDGDTTTPMFPACQWYGNITSPVGGYPNGSSLEDLRVLDVADWAAQGILNFLERFTRADSATEIGNGWTADLGTWGITSGKAYLIVPEENNTAYRATHATTVPVGDRLFSWDVTMPDAATPNWSLYFRYQDANNYWRIHNNNLTNSINIARRLNGGVEAAIAGTGANINWVAGQTYRITLLDDYVGMTVFVDNVLRLRYLTVNPDLASATTIGVGIPFNTTVPGNAGTAGCKFDNVLVAPTLVTLPSVFSSGKIPTILTPGAVLAQDSFTDTDETDLTLHTAEAGGAWVADYVTEVDTQSTWQIIGGKADLMLPLTNDSNVVQDVGSANAEAQLDITIPDPYAAGGYIICGIAFRYVDRGNYCYARITHVPYAANNDEIEMFGFAGGVQKFYHKAQIGVYNTAGATQTLKVQAKGDLAHVFINDQPIISYYFEADDARGTKWGIHVSRRAGEIGDEGALFDNWIVKAL